jgi:hypothetical protein
VAGVDQLLTSATLTSLTAGLSSQDKSTELRVVVVPSQFVDVAYVPLFSELRVVAVADSASSALRLAVSTGYNPWSFRGYPGKRVIEQSNDDFDCSNLAPGTQAMANCNNRRTAAQWRALRRRWIPSVFATLGYDLYPFGRQPDAADPTREVELQWNGGVTGQLALELRPGELARLSLWGTAKYARPDGAPEAKLARYLGAGATVSFLAWPLLSEAERTQSADYRRDGFLPGVGLGASFQVSRCDGQEKCAKLRTSQWSVSPFLDILASASLQLRLSVPITRYEAVDSDGVDVAGTFSVGGNLGKL